MSKQTMADKLDQINKYYTRVAKQEGGFQFAELLNDFNQLREKLQGAPEKAVKSRVMIKNYMNKIEELLN